ncbi:hypothetical protein NBRC10512_002054 [Rhodotorula toruloides]|uniref:RHTO0S02e07294g1_1 n=2 Tax=Rhodotorula toruloides TaxID=5286 RepID=A0A061AQ26_RHOTO|nr:zinc finger, C2H2-type domain containing protein, transcription factor [Rhodotorula toruloides NP11]EMS19130.1 zinc finger, C2H2-type domain containing protein, transcription factor [Rhodotorula toruloides NP11]CDR36824.1 RHTO0S02e07294g1_1 [Rhodotorula toruloides]
MGRNKDPDVRHFCAHPGCTKSFSRADHLKRHTANHDPEQRKNCPECGRSFTRSDVLFAHLKKHEVAEGGATKERSPSPPEPNGGAGMPNLPETPGDGGLDDLYGWLLADSGPGWLDPLPDLAFNLEGDIAALPFDWSILSLNTGGPSASTSNIFLPSSPPTDVTEPLRLSLCTYLLSAQSLASHPLATCSTFSSALSRYWQTFHPQLPIVHTSTFDPTRSLGLLSAMIVVGLCLQPDANVRTFGQQLFPHVRPMLMLHEASVPPIPLGAFQALTILGQAGQMLLDQKRHDMAYPDSAYEVTIGRLMDVFSWRFYTKMSAQVAQAQTEDERWQAWIESESWRRVAFAVIMRDIELSTIFQHLPTRALSILLIRLALPSDDDRWTAASSSAWRACQATPDIPFPYAVKHALSISTASTAPPATPPHLNPFARYCVIHGLMSVGWDVKWRGSLRAAAIESVQRNWRGSLRDAYRQLRTDIILTVDLPFLSASERSISLTSLDLLLVAELDLLADLTSILTFAGVDRIAARTVGPEDFSLAGKAVRKWVSTDEGLQAAELAGSYLTQRLQPEILERGWTAADGMYGPWAIYIATLVVWIFGSLRPAPFAYPSATSEQANGLFLHRDFPILYRAEDIPLFLAQIAALLQGQQWGIGHDAAAILRGLLQRKL